MAYAVVYAQKRFEEKKRAKGFLVELDFIKKIKLFEENKIHFRIF